MAKGSISKMAEERTKRIMQETFFAGAGAPVPNTGKPLIGSTKVVKRPDVQSPGPSAPVGVDEGAMQLRTRLRAEEQTGEVKRRKRAQR